MDKRPSLRQFQESLAVRLREAASETVSASRLGLQSGGRHWLLKLEDAGEIVPVPELTPIPLTKPWFLGLVNVRGVLVSVVDLSLFSGGRPTPRTPEARIVLVAERWQVRAGLLVDRMLGLHAVDKMQPAPPDGAGRESGHPGRPWVGAELMDAAERRWTQLELQVLVTSNEFLQAGA